MECYQKMYYRLFNAVTDVINKLQTAQAETEDLFLSNKTGQTMFELPGKDKTQSDSDFTPIDG